jgi:hypothetical protein
VKRLAPQVALTRTLRVNQKDLTSPAGTFAAASPLAAGPPRLCEDDKQREHRPREALEWQTI